MSTLLDRFEERMPNAALWRTGLNALLTMQEIYDTYTYTNLPDFETQRLCDSIAKHYRACKRLRIASKPKHHFMMELAMRTKSCGALALCATFPDEGLNRVIKTIGGSAHRLNWTLRTLDEFEAAQRIGQTPGARKRKAV